ncbi:ABC transporter ATP-binding protein [Candidatus Woesearchaeota archaeon]|nr:ABC transporter ATP-binding protein [Candidatus Woesearchaeota archaeon]
MIDIRNVWKIYQMGNVKVIALKDLDFKVEQGEFVSIMGPSGSGKSTAVNMVGALDVPTKGHIYLEGKDICKLSESALAQIRGRKIGFIFQQFNLIPTLSALENVMLPMMFQNIDRNKRLERAKHLLELVGLGDRIYHKPSELSGGQQQRVAFARALSNDPDVVLADEPTGNLDTRTGAQVIELLAKLHIEENKTIIMVTHDKNVAEHADRIEYLKDGQIVKSTKRIKKLEKHYLRGEQNGKKKH